MYFYGQQASHNGYIICLNQQILQSWIRTCVKSYIVYHTVLILCKSYYLRFRILSKDCPLLKLLGNTLPYETAIGMNGRVWIKGRSTVETIAIINAIDKSEFMSNDQIKVMVRQTVDRLRGFWYWKSELSSGWLLTETGIFNRQFSVYLMKFLL